MIIDWSHHKKRPPSRLGRIIIDLSEADKVEGHTIHMKNGTVHTLGTPNPEYAKRCDQEGRPLLPWKV